MKWVFSVLLLLVPLTVVGQITLEWEGPVDDNYQDRWVYLGADGMKYLVQTTQTYTIMDGPYSTAPWRTYTIPNGWYYPTFIPDVSGDGEWDFVMYSREAVRICQLDGTIIYTVSCNSDIENFDDVWVEDIDLDGFLELVCYMNNLYSSSDDYYRVYSLGNQSSVDGFYENSMNTQMLSNVQCYPNPSNNEIRVTYYLTNTADVHIRMYNLLGRQVLSSHIGMQTPGSHSYQWQAGETASGTYFIQITAGDQSFTVQSVVTR